MPPEGSTARVGVRFTIEGKDELFSDLRSIGSQIASILAPRSGNDANPLAISNVGGPPSSAAYASYASPSGPVSSVTPWFAQGPQAGLGNPFASAQSLTINVQTMHVQTMHVQTMHAGGLGAGVTGASATGGGGGAVPSMVGEGGPPWVPAAVAAGQQLGGRIWSSRLGRVGLMAGAMGLVSTAAAATDIGDVAGGGMEGIGADVLGGALESPWGAAALSLGGVGLAALLARTGASANVVRALRNVLPGGMRGLAGAGLIGTVSYLGYQGVQGYMGAYVEPGWRGEAPSPEQRDARMLGALGIIPYFRRASSQVEMTGDLRDWSIQMGLGGQSGSTWQGAALVLAEQIRRAQGIREGGERPAMEMLDVLARVPGLGLSTDFSEVTAGQIARHWGSRSTVAVSAAQAAAQAASLGMRNPDISAALLSRKALNAGMGDAEYRALALEAVLSGDVSMLDVLIEGGKSAFGRDFGKSLAGNMGAVSATRQNALTMELSGLEAQQAGVGVSLAETTRRGAGAVSMAMGSHERAMRTNLRDTDRQIAHWESVLVGQPENRMAARMLEQLRVQRGTLAVQAEGMGYEIAEVQFAGREAIGGALVQRGETYLGLASGMGDLPGARSERAFAAQREGLTIQIGAQRRLLGFLESRQAGADVIAPHTARLRAMETQETLLGLRETDWGFERRGAVLSAQGGIQQTRYGSALLTEFAGSGNRAAFDALEEGLQRVLRMRVEQMGRYVEERRGPVETEAIRAEIEQLQARIRQTVIQRARAEHEDALARLALPGQIAGYELGAMRALGTMPGARMEGALSRQQDSLIARRGETQAAWADAERRGDYRAAQQYRREYEQINAEIESLPVAQARARYDPLAAVAQAEVGIASSAVSGALARGAGALDVLPGLNTEIERQQEQAAVLRRHINTLKRIPGADAALIRPLEAGLASMEAGIAQTEAGRGNLPLPTSMQGARAGLEYAFSMLTSTPGSYGNVRAAGRGLMSQIEREGQYYGRLAESLPEGSPERLAATRHVYAAGREWMGIAKEMAFGWENRLVSQALGLPGSFDLEGRGFAIADAVSGWGVVNPMMGSSQANLPWFLRMAQLVGQPVLPGVRNWPGTGGPGVWGAAPLVGSALSAGPGAATAAGRAGIEAAARPGGGRGAPGSVSEALIDLGERAIAAGRALASEERGGGAVAATEAVSGSGLEQLAAEMDILLATRQARDGG